MVHLAAFAQYSELWGVAYIGGANDAGFIFKMDDDGSNYQVMYEFLGSDNGDNPHTKVVEGPNGLLYGIAAGGGINDKGIIYTYDRDYNSFEIDHHLEMYIGSALTLAPNGKFYTLTSSYLGAICEYDPDTKTLSIAYDYSVDEGKTVLAEGVLITVGDNLLYGVTYSGGNHDNGVLFEYNINTGIYTVKHHFDGLEGSKPSGYIAYTNGKIYGTTTWGGNNNKGVFFEYDINESDYNVRKHLETSHTTPGGICIGPDGYIYGHSSIGGSNNGGAIWRYDTATYNMEFVHEFVDNSGPYLPTGAPMVTYNGKIFGATRYGGGGMGLGTIYEYNTTTETAEVRQGLNDGFPLNTILTEIGERTVTSITIDAPATTIDLDNGSLQLDVTMLPAEANDQPVVWSVDDTDLASISDNGLLTAIDNGVVTVTATANYGLGVSTTIDITISNQDGTPPVIPVSSLTVTSATSSITSFGSTMQMNTEVLPANASDKSVSWDVSDNSIATISTSGVLTAVSAGVVTVSAVANDGSGISGSKEISITNYVTSISITPDTDIIDEPFASIDFDAVLEPADATNSEVEWSVNYASKATINQDGVLTAKDNSLGYVTITCKALDGSGVEATHNVTITNQDEGIPVTSIEITAPKYTIDTDGETLQMTPAIEPANATNQSIIWSVGNPDVMTVDQNGLITPVGNGLTFVKAEVHTGIAGVKMIEVSNQSSGPFPLEEILFDPDTYYINTYGGSVQLTPELLPLNTADADVTVNWSSSNNCSTITSDGLVTATADGTEEIVAYAYNMNSKMIVSNRVYVVITNQIATGQEQITETTADIVLYPNPAKDYISIELPVDEYTSASIIDLTGRTLRREELETDKVTLNISDLEKGIYLLNFSGKEGASRIKRFVKK